MCVIFKVPYNLVFPVPVALHYAASCQARHVSICITLIFRYVLHNTEISYPGAQTIIESDYTIGHF